MVYFFYFFSVENKISSWHIFCLLVQDFHSIFKAFLKCAPKGEGQNTSSIEYNIVLDCTKGGESAQFEKILVEENYSKFYFLSLF